MFLVKLLHNQLNKSISLKGLKRPELKDMIDLAILVEAPDEVRRKKLQEREGEIYMKKWHSLWDEDEELYFQKIAPPSAFNLVIQPYS